MRALADRASAERPAPIALLGAAAVHGFLVVGFVLSAQQPQRAPLPAYAVELIAAPRAAAQADQPTPGAAKAAPAPVRPRPAESKRAAPAPARPAAPSPPAPSARPPVRPSGANAPPAAAASPNTSAASGTGTAPATIRTVGVEFPFEGYLRNLVAQVYRRWHPPSGNADLESEMLFFVHRDGSITGLQFVKRSGSFAFDLEAQGAVEAAARAGAFGALPAGFAPDMLPVSFFFSPRSMR